MALNFESVVSDYKQLEKLVNDNWLNVQRHLPSVGVNVTSEYYCKIRRLQSSSSKGHKYPDFLELWNLTMYLAFNKTFDIPL